MRVLLDADCLIKVTRAGFKEQVVRHFSVSAPRSVMDEVVAQGAARSDAAVVRSNAERGAIEVSDDRSVGGDDALVQVFNTGRFDVVGTDDRKLIRRMTALGIPCVTPGVMIYQLVRMGAVERSDALSFLARLGPLISREELQMVRFLLEEP